MDDNLIQIIIQGGGLGTALVALFILWKVVMNHGAQTNEIIKGTTEAIVENAKSNAQLSETLGTHSEVIRSLQSTIERKL